MLASAIGPPPDDTKTYSLFYAFLLSICCRYTAAFFFCASSNSRFNSLTIAISLAGSVSATASRQRSRQSLRASWVIDASQKRTNYSNVIAEMLSRPTCAKLVLLCKPASPPLTISIAKRKRSLWPSSPPSFILTLRVIQGKRDFTEGKSRAEQQSTAGEREGTGETRALPRGEVASVSSVVPTSVLHPT